MGVQKSAEAVEVANNSVTKGGTSYAASRRQSLVEYRNAEISSREGCFSESRTVSEQHHLACRTNLGSVASRKPASPIAKQRLATPIL